MKKFSQVIKEGYEMEMDAYDDFATEHAKMVISAYIDGDLKGVTIQDAFRSMLKEMDLEGAENESSQQTVIKAMESYLYKMLRQTEGLSVFTFSEVTSPLGDNEDVGGEPGDTEGQEQRGLEDTEGRTTEEEE